MRIRKTARPSTLPGVGRGRGRKMKIGPCSKCGAEGRLIHDACYRCYQHERYRMRRLGSRPTESWISDWLKRQVRNYLKENNIPVQLEPQILELCRLIYLAKRHHNDKRGPHPGDNYARRDNSREGEGDGFYLDKGISPELKGLAK